MSLNLMFTFTIFLLMLVCVNVYFFYIITANRDQSNVFHAIHKSFEDRQAEDFPLIFEYLKRLPSQYRRTNDKFFPYQKQLYKSFNVTLNPPQLDLWNIVDEWTSETSLFPDYGDVPLQILKAIQQSNIILADNAPKGTQLKLLLLLEGQHKLFFKPKRYDVDEVITGDVYAGFDRHNSEILAYFLAMIMNLRWVAPAVGRKLNVAKDILPVATPELRKTMVKKGESQCMYGKCFYCKPNETVCTDSNGEIDGAAILYLDKSFRVYKLPWRRSYTSKKMEWQIDDSYCVKVKAYMSANRLLDLIDISIFDFLIQNGDRHRYEVYKDKIVLLDNGKGLGNPWTDAIDILAPLYQCCSMRLSTWQHLEILSGGVLTNTLKNLISLQGNTLVNDNHYAAIERRLLKVFATVQMCIGKNGSAKVFK